MQKIELTENCPSPELNCLECDCYDFCNDKKLFENVPGAGLSHDAINRIIGSLTMRQKLINLLQGHSLDTTDDVEYMADYLLQNGVYMKRMIL